MNVHKNARLTPRGRERIVRQVESGQTPEAVAEAAGVCPRTVRKWVDRYRREGLAGLQDRSSRPHRLRRPTPQAVVEEIERLRRQRWTGKQIAAETGVSPATVSRVLRRLGLNKLSALEPAEPIRRYERENPGELIHLDIKKLGRIGSVGPPHHRAISWRGQPSPRHRLGVRPCLHRRCLAGRVRAGAGRSAQGKCGRLPGGRRCLLCQAWRPHRARDDGQRLVLSVKEFRAACKRLGLRQIFTRPYTPRTNGKAERFIQTALREWAYARAYHNSDQRSAELLHWLHRYNWHRPHGSLKANTPISRLGLSEDNLLRLHS